MKIKKIEYYTKSNLLDRGWNEKSICELLPPPQLVANPYYKCASPMQLFEKKIVERKERTKKFQKYAEENAKRSKSSKKAVETKIKKTMQLLPTLSLEVERVDLELLRQSTLNCKWQWYQDTEQYGRALSVDIVDEETLLRWELNFIRHNLTNYDDELSKIFAKVGKNIVYSKYKTELMTKIFEVYPELEQKSNEFKKAI